ncbi:MAG: hypothetical protein WB424_12275 [Terracidiphilus sp.]
MRPPKKILVWSEREEEAGVLVFVLSTHARFCVKKAATMQEFMNALGEEWDLVILPHAVSSRWTSRRAELVKRSQDCPILILSWDKNIPAPKLPEVSAVLPYEATIFEVLEKIRFLMIRKRGPSGHGRCPTCATEVSLLSTVTICQ